MPAEDGSSDKQNKPTEDRDTVDSSLERFAGLLDGVEDSEGTAGERLAARVLMSEKYSGAFPHPSFLREYDGVVTDGAERAFALTEKEQDHRHSCDTKLVDQEVESRRAEDSDRRLVIIGCMILVALGLIGAVALALADKNLPGGLVGGASILVALAGGIAVRKKGLAAATDRNSKSE